MICLLPLQAPLLVVLAPGLAKAIRSPFAAESRRLLRRKVVARRRKVVSDRELALEIDDCSVSSSICL